MTGWLARQEIGGAVLYQGDMREVLFDADPKADLCVTDAPYALTSGGKRRSMGGKFSPEKYDNSGHLMKSLPWHEMAGPIFRALADDADAYVMCNDRHVADCQSAFRMAGFRCHNLLTWDKGAPVRSRYYMKNQEYTSFFWRGRARELNYGGAKQCFKCNRPALDWHVTAKPFALMALYVLQSSNPGDLVLDPFMGSAPTIMAALAFGRRAIGVELEAEYFDKACARVEAAHQSGFAQEIAEWEAARVANGLKGLAHAA